MNREDFMRRLAELLADVSPAERDEAIKYYNDYFDDAGAENEQSVIVSLGSPEQLARTIKAGLADSGAVGEFTEKGFSVYEQKKSDEVLDLSYISKMEKGSPSGSTQSENSSGQQGSGQNESDSWQQKKSKQLSGGTIALIAVLCILASPFLLGICGGLFGIVIGILGGLFGIIVGVGAAAIALMIVSVCLFVYGIVLLFSIPLGGLAMMGIGMILMAAGLLCLWLTVVICAMLVPAIIRGIVKLFCMIFHKGGVKA